MSLFLNPQVSTNGLRFVYDSGNRKSYRGPPIQNRLTSISPLTTSGSGYSFIGGSEIVDIPTIGPTTVQYSNIQNNYSAVSTWCCPNPFSYNGGGTVSVSGSTLYTYAIVYKCESNYTNGNYMYRYEYNSSNTYLTEAGVHNDGNRIHLGNGWYWAWATFTTQATASYINPYSFYYRYSTSYDKLSVAKIMLVQGDYTGLHPRYWPDVLTTRSTSDTIADPIGKNSVTANSLTYASNGDISFNGTGNYLTLPASVGTFGTADFTIDCWWKSNGTQSSYTAIIEQGFTGSPSSGAWAFKVSHSSADINFTYCTPTISDNLSSNSPNDGAWHNLVAVRSGTTLTLYKDAVVVKTATLPSGFSFGEGSSVFVGYNPRDGSYLKGYLPSLKIYGRAMGIDEVLQNFNAQRGRYGI